MKFLVLSYYDDHQYWFYDIVRTESCEDVAARIEACEIVLDIRPYVIASVAFDENDLARYLGLVKEI